VAAPAEGPAWIGASDTATVVHIPARPAHALSGIPARADTRLMIWRLRLALRIPRLAVLGGCVFKVGIDIVDWGFLAGCQSSPKGCPDHDISVVALNRAPST